MTALNLHYGGLLSFTFTPDNPEWRENIYSIKVKEFDLVRDFFSHFNINEPGVIGTTNIGYGSSFDVDFVDYEITFSATGFKDQVVKVTVPNNRY
ncbi:hemoblobin-interacting domain-containing protein [Bacillus infantis]|uniref:hemoblobin-interacting domain-containing protein n=1 Tax=Bacillus infantis TaxID=324767 RepID=UPI003CF85168